MSRTMLAVHFLGPMMFLFGMLRSPTMALRVPPTSRDCNQIDPVKPPDLEALSEEDRSRFLAVQGAIKHAWKGYRATVMNQWTIYWADDLMPISGKGKDWLHAAATLYDSLDTLYLAGLTKEYQDGIRLLKRAPFPVQPTKTFEYSIRVVGGLLGAYSVSGDPFLLAAAIQAADAILEGPFKASPTPLPRPFQVLAPPSYSFGWSLSASFWWNLVARNCHRLWATLYSVGRDYLGEHTTNSLAGVGSFAVEFEYLSLVTKATRFRDAADSIFRHVSWEPKGSSHMISTGWNVMTGRSTTSFSNLGSGSDSFYEYLIKVVLLKKADDPLRAPYLELYHDVVHEALLSSSNMKHATMWDGRLFPVDGLQYHHLLSFVPGMLALGESQEGCQTGDIRLMEIAHDMTDACYSTYNQTSTGLGAEHIAIRLNGYQVVDTGYYLRPELVESLFVMYRSTGEKRYQEMAWNIFQSIEKHCKVEHGAHGYASIKDVNDLSKGYLDEMPSFFIGETLKYLMLIFLPDDYISLDDFVFTTEAHPLRRGSSESSTACYSVNDLVDPPIAFPLALGLNLVLVTLFLSVRWLIKARMFPRRFWNRENVDNKLAKVL